MALRALIFSKDADATTALTSVLAENGFEVEVCSDTFKAVEKGTKQSWACVIVDWCEQPEAGFLLRRARESEANRAAVPIAIVNEEPPSEHLRDHRLDFLFYRPIIADEIRAVLSKARQKMEMHASMQVSETQVARAQTFSGPSREEAPSEDPDLMPVTAKVPFRAAERTSEKQGAAVDERIAEDEPQSFVASAPEEIPEETDESPLPERRFSLRQVGAVALLLLAGFLFYRGRDAFTYLRSAPEGPARILRDSIASLFYANGSGAQAVPTVATDAQSDAYFNRAPGNSQDAHTSEVGVVSAEVSLPDAPRQLPPPLDLPLPSPELVRVPAPPVHTQRAAIPDSMRTSAPIAAPVVVTVGPGQMMPVSAPILTSQPQQFSEPVPITEDAARALLIQSVDPVYPNEAAQKLQGTVVVQAVIARDGSVQDLKFVRGYFALAKPAIAAVRQWRFQPFTVNGKPAAAQTNLTVKFSPPA
jgi:TonB family protein